MPEAIALAEKGRLPPRFIVRATIDGLSKVNTPSEIAAKRGLSVEQILG